MVIVPCCGERDHTLRRQADKAREHNGCMGMGKNRTMIEAKLGALSTEGGHAHGAIPSPENTSQALCHDCELVAVWDGFVPKERTFGLAARQYFPKTPGDPVIFMKTQQVDEGMVWSLANGKNQPLDSKPVSSVENRVSSMEMMIVK